MITFLVQSEGYYTPSVVNECINGDERIIIIRISTSRILSTLLEADMDASNYRVVFTSVAGRYANIIREIIILFPEVNFYFTDGDWYNNLLSIPKGITSSQIDQLRKIYYLLDRKETSFDLKGLPQGDYIPCIILIKHKITNRQDFTSELNELKFLIDVLSVNIAFHSIEKTSIEKLKEISDRENLFDASNLRYAVKQFIFNEKKVKQNNAHVLESRANNIAYVIDEESVQCRQLSYCLYANGMRAFPVSTKTLLTYASKQWKGQHDKIILRDFDLQFKDEDQGGNITREHGYCETDFIRGYKYNSTTKRWENLISETYCPFDDCAISCDYNPYWHKEDLKYTYCVSQGYSGLDIVDSNKCDGWKISDDKRRLKVPGVEKPVSGIYKELTENIFPIKERFLHKFQDTDIDLKRINREHSTPLGLYDIALNIFRRAECYLHEHNFVKAAVLSQEAIEILNGYHTSLFLQAYHIHALAENAIAMNMLGCDETSMAEDCKIRIDIIRHDVSRMLRYTTFDSKNILNQIYADCRQYCHEKEHFQSEEVFIDAMAKLNDGLDIIGPILNFLKKITSRLKDK